MRITPIQLREHAKILRTDGVGFARSNKLLDLAADEIERLLELIRQNCNGDVVALAERKEQTTMNIIDLKRLAEECEDAIRRSDDREPAISDSYSHHTSPPRKAPSVHDQLNQVLKAVAALCRHQIKD